MVPEQSKNEPIMVITRASCSSLWMIAKDTESESCPLTLCTLTSASRLAVTKLRSNPISVHLSLQFGQQLALLEAYLPRRASIMTIDLSSKVSGKTLPAFLQRRVKQEGCDQPVLS